jgi:hypothetical protein
VRGAAVHEQVDEAAGLAGEVRLFGSQRGDVRGSGGQPAVVAEHSGQAEQTETHTAAAQQVAAGKAKGVEEGWVARQ